MHPITSIACAISLLAATGMAQGISYGPTGGQNLLSFGGAIGAQNIDNAGNDTLTSIYLQAGFGHFLTLEHEVGGQLNEIYSDSDASGADPLIATSLTGYYNYNWRSTPRTWFYGGPHLGVLLIDAGGTDDTNLAIGIHGGIRHWLTESSAVFAEPRLTISEFDGDSVRTAEVIFGYSVVL